MVVTQLGLGDEALAETFRRMAFNVMARNCDDHTKNFAFRLSEGGAWELTPAFDVTHAYNPNGEWTYQHLMSVNGKFDGIGREDLLAVAQRFRVRRPRDILAKVRDAVVRWADFAAEAALPGSDTAAVAADHRPL
jgi:serine/threonine-protein kinase HipA